MEKENKETEEMKKRQQDILKALAVSWAERALGKMSHAAFNNCMEHVRGIVPSDVWKVLSKATIHYHDPLEMWIKGMREFQIPSEVAWMIGGDSPSIDRLQKMANEFEVE